MVETLKEYCKDLTSEELTRTFERELEGISSNELTKEKILEDGEKEVRSILKDIHNNEEKIGSMLYGAYQETNVVGECACGGKLIKRHSPRYKTSFIGCSNFPKCRVTYSVFQRHRKCYFELRCNQNHLLEQVQSPYKDLAPRHCQGLFQNFPMNSIPYP